MRRFTTSLGQGYINGRHADVIVEEEQVAVTNHKLARKGKANIRVAASAGRRK